MCESQLNTAVNTHPVAMPSSAANILRNENEWWPRSTNTSCGFDCGKIRGPEMEQSAKSALTMAGDYKSIPVHLQRPVIM